MKRKITFKEKPLTLLGLPLREGDMARDFKVVSGKMDEISLSNYQGKIKVLTTFLSLDTKVCDLQVKEFNKRASGLSDEVRVVAISKDLPFAQERFCQANRIENVDVLSDYKASSFGLNYGLLIKELNLLARSVMIIDKNNVLRYLEIVDEATNAPDYDAAIKKLEEVLDNPALSINGKEKKQCVPCEKGTPPLNEAQIKNKLSKIKGWEVVENKKLTKEFKRKNYSETKDLLDLITLLAEEQGHHPRLTLTYNKLKVTFSTHAAGGLTDNDFVMAGLIDQLTGEDE